jgi:hypothetical protein
MLQYAQYIYAELPAYKLISTIMDSLTDAALRETFKVGEFYYSYERSEKPNAPVGQHAYEIVEYCDPSGFGPAVRCRILDKDDPRHRDGSGIVLFSLSDLGRKYSTKDEEGKPVIGLPFFTSIINRRVLAELGLQRLSMYPSLAETPFLQGILEREARRTLCNK